MHRRLRDWPFERANKCRLVKEIEVETFKNHVKFVLFESLRSASYSLPRGMLVLEARPSDITS